MRDTGMNNKRAGLADESEWLWIGNLQAFRKNAICLEHQLYSFIKIRARLLKCPSLGVCTRKFFDVSDVSFVYLFKHCGAL